MLKQVALAWKSYFAACAEWEAESRQIPGPSQAAQYLDKQGRNLLTYTEQAISRAPKNRWVGRPLGTSDIRIETARRYRPGAHRAACYPLHHGGIYERP